MRTTVQTDTTNSFGTLLQDLRRRAGLTQIQLADFSTVSVRAIRDLELGRAQRPRRDTVRLLADALRLTRERRAALEVAAGRDVTDAVLHASYGARPVPPPAPAGPLLGRQEEAELLRDLLVSGPDRLVTVTGMGGVGKTRLVLAVAHALYERGRTPVLWVESSVGASLRPDQGLDSRPGQPFQVLAPWLREILDREDGEVDDLAGFIADRPFLLVLDGYEPERLPAGAVLRLLSQCPKLRVVTTARAYGAAPIAGQRLFPLHPLPVGPNPDQHPDFAADQDAAARTTLDAAAPLDPPDAAAEIVRWHLRNLRPQWHAGRGEDAAIRELCRLLDGIPLALEAAAAWSLIASPVRLAASAARDPFAVAAPPSERGSTGRLYAALAEAIEDLDPAEHDFLAVLSTWERPWALEDAAACTGQSLGESAYAAHTLLMHNLIRPADAESGISGTFTVLNTVRHLMRMARPVPTLATRRSAALETADHGLPARLVSLVK